MASPAETKKILIVVVVLVLLLGGILVIRQQRKPVSISTTNTPLIEVTPTVIKETPAGVYGVELTPKSIKIGETTSANINFTAKDKVVSGTDVVLRFNPEFLEASEDVTTGDFFSSYPRKEVSNKDGLVKVTGFSPVRAAPLESAVPVFTVNFKAKKAGSTKLSFDFALGKTNLSTIVEKGTSKNILGEVKEAIVLIEP